MLTLLSALSFPLALVNAYGDPGTCSGNCWAHDPGLYQRESDGKYFLFSTGGGIQISSADALQGPWTQVGQALPSGSIIDHDGNTNLWAPDVHYQDGTYYMYYAVSTLGSQNSIIGVATSPTMEVGNWTDQGSTGLTSDGSQGYNTIDANWIKIGDTQILNFGSYWQGLYQVELTSPLKVGSTAPNNIAYNASGNHAIEAPFLFEYNSYFYLFFSSGKANGYDTSLPAQGLEYRINVCRSETGRGGFVDKNGVSCLESGGTTVLASHGNVYGPGGQGVLNDKTLGPVLYYHYADKTIGLAVTDYRFGWNRLSWTDGWPVV